MALIIVNQDYSRRIGWLANTPVDGDLMRDALAKARFEITYLKDRDELDLLDDIKKFADSVTHMTGSYPRKKPVTFFYYSGHGASDGSENYIIPARAEIRDASELQRKGVSETGIVDIFARLNNDSNFIVLDACRDVAFPYGHHEGTKGLVPLAKTAKVTNVLVAHAAAPNTVTRDDNRYARTLAQHITRRPGAPALFMFKQVRAQIATQREQTPGDIIEMRDRVLSLAKEFYFQPPAEVDIKPSVPQVANGRAWKPIQSLNSAKLFFVRTSRYYRHPDRKTDPNGELPAGTQVTGPVEYGFANGSQWYKYLNLFGREVYSPADEAETIGDD